MTKPFDLSKTLGRRGIKHADLARAMGVQRSTVSRWCRKRVPPERCRDLSGYLGIPMHVIRPDIFPAPQGAANPASVAWWTPDDVHINPYGGRNHGSRLLSATVIDPVSVEEVSDIIRQAGGSVDE